MGRTRGLLLLLFPALLAVQAAALPPDFERKDWVSTGLVSPLAMKWSPDGRLFVLEQAGHVRIIENGVLLPTRFATVKTWTGHRESMLGVAFDPDFAANGYVYLYYSENGVQKNRITRLTSSKTDRNVAEPASEVVLLDQIGTAAYQGGAFFFGKDKMLYAASAHGGSQNLNDLGGKVLRINPATYPNVIPADNPFVGQAGKRAEIWAYGLREPFTGAADTVTGNMVVNDVGDGKAEEINLVKKGANYGYEAGCEGTCAKAGMENPWVEYGRNVGGCITGAAFYYGKSFPGEYTGSLFYADWGAVWIKRRAADGKVHDFDTGNGKVIQLDVGPDGALYTLKINGENPPWTGAVQRIRYTGTVGVTPHRRDGASRLGPEVSVARGAGAPGIRFLLGGNPARGATLDIRDGLGRPVAALEARPGAAYLAWDFSHRAPRPGLYAYDLRTYAADGQPRRLTGSLLVLE